MEGEKFHRWTVKRFSHTQEYKCGSKQKHWVCECECGTIRSVEQGSLKRGLSKSCGCHNEETRKERSTTHGMSGSPTFNTWLSMRRRCRDSHHASYKDYGACGIDVCDEWYDSFLKFYQDMGERPFNMTLDRIDSTRGYYKENCRWADTTTQSRNTRKLKKTASKYKYVYKANKSDKWVSSINGVGGEYSYLGVFDTQEEAAKTSYEEYKRIFGTWPPYCEEHLHEIGICIKE